MRVMCIDPGSKTTGWAYTEIEPDCYDAVKPIKSGRIKIGDGTIYRRGMALIVKIDELINYYGVEHIYSENTTVVDQLGMAAKDALAFLKVNIAGLAEMHEIPINFVSPMTIKAAVAHGRATKDEIINAIHMIYNIPPLDDNHADALALCFCVQTRRHLLEAKKKEREHGRKPHRRNVRTRI